MNVVALDTNVVLRLVHSAAAEHIAEYLTELPRGEVLEDRLHRAIEAARNGLSLRVDGSPVGPLPPTQHRARSNKKTPRQRSR
jgi:hypothetical protein